MMRRFHASKLPTRIGPLALMLLAAPVGAAAAPPGDLTEYRQRVETDLRAALDQAIPEAPMHRQACVGGMAGGVYPCDNIDLLEFMPVATFGAGETNSLWGWTDSTTQKEYALLGLDNGTAFIDITDPESPIYLGKLPTHTGTSLWRDVRTYQDHAYIVADNNGAHGMQVFDLTRLRNVVAPPVTFTEDAHYNGVTNVHTISINESTGHAVLVGSNTCSGGLHIVDITSPEVPTFAGCYNDGGYVHENQCFTYQGPDTDCDPVAPGPQACAGREICLAARGSAEAIDIIDITNPAVPVRLDTFRYQPVGVSSYSHQAWFTEDHRYVLLNDEFDEQNQGVNTRTWLFDAADLNNVVFAGPVGYHDHATQSIDHNLYVRGNFVFESNYRAGLRILRLTDLAQGLIEEVAYFDLDPASDDNSFAANWNNYPFFASGNVIASHIEQGLYILDPTSLCETPATPTGLSAVGNGDHRIDLAWTGSGAPGEQYRIERALGGCGETFETIADGVTATAYSDLTASGVVTYGYRVRAVNGECLSEPSACVEASTTGSCTAPPLFAGLATATNGGTATCRVDLGWTAATPLCDGPATYSVYRGTSADFTPSAANRIANNVTGTGYQDFSAPSLETVFYVVRATDSANGAEEGNLVRRDARAAGPIGDGTFATGAEVGDPMFDTGDVFAPGAPPEAPEHAGWHVSTVRKHSGNRSFWSTDSDNMCVTLEGDVTLTGGQSSQLSFWTAWDIESGWDGGVIDVSTNGGASWTRLTPVGGYPGTITNGGSLCGIAQGSGAFTGEGQFTFVAENVSLASYAGQSIRLRWLYRTDTTITGEGWYVDDVAITHAQVPSACTSNVLLIADHEEGDTSDWSSTVP